MDQALQYYANVRVGSVLIYKSPPDNNINASVVRKAFAKLFVNDVFCM